MEQLLHSESRGTSVSRRAHSPPVCGVGRHWLANNDTELQTGMRARKGQFIDLRGQRTRNLPNLGIRDCFLGGMILESWRTRRDGLRTCSVGALLRQVGAP